MTHRNTLENTAYDDHGDVFSSTQDDGSNHEEDAAVQHHTLAPVVPATSHALQSAGVLLVHHACNAKGHDRFAALQLDMQLLCCLCRCI